MNQFALTKSIDTYLKHNNLTMIEQSSWNNGVVVFKIEDGTVCRNHWLLFI